MDLTEVACEEDVVWVHTAQAKVCSCFCEYGNESLGSVKGKKLFYSLTVY